MGNGMEEMALMYFHNLPKGQKRKLMQKIVNLLNDDEKIELAKMIIKK